MKSLVALLTIIALILGMGISPNSFAQRPQIQQNQQAKKDINHKKWSDILSISQNNTKGKKAFLKTDTGDKIPVLAVKMPGMQKYSDITLKRGVMKSMPKLQESLAKGKIIPRMRLIVYVSTEKGKEQQHYTVELVNATISSIRTESTSNSAADSIPVENFSLNFEEIKVVEISKDKSGKQQRKLVYKK